MKAEPYLKGWVAVGAWIENEAEDMPEFMPIYMTGPQEERMVATAQLFAAAPDMLDALNYLVGHGQDGAWDMPTALEKAKAAISKATEG